MWSLRLRLELLRWRLAGRRARLWWRDDDAWEPTPELERLLGLAGDAAVPLTLAVIPAGDITGLAAVLAHRSGVTAVQHGVDHRNRRLGPAAGEFPHDWPLSRLKSELSLGWTRLAGLPGALAVFVPPWNDVHPRLEAALEACGYRAWSAHGELAAAGLPRVDAHLDLLRWRGGSRFRGRGRMLAALTSALARRRRSRLWAAPIGLLTHHLAHDEAAWRFLAKFLAWSTGRTELEWVSLRSLVPAPGAVAHSRNAA